jgi:hypothetical protein
MKQSLDFRRSGGLKPAENETDITVDQENLR